MEERWGCCHPICALQLLAWVKGYTIPVERCNVARLLGGFVTYGLPLLRRTFHLSADLQAMSRHHVLAPPVRLYRRHSCVIHGRDDPLLIGDSVVQTTLLTALRHRKNRDDNHQTDDTS